MFAKENIHLNNEPQNNIALTAAFWSVGTVVILLSLKIYAYYLSGSVAILGSLTDSATDLLVSFMMLLAIRISLQPADAHHRHGHGKVEGIAALFQSAFLTGAGIFLSFESLSHLVSPSPLQNSMVCLAVSVISVFLTTILIVIQRWAITKTGSLALQSDQAHYNSDIILNIGVIISILAQYYGGPAIIDPIMGIFIAIYILKTAFSVGKNAADMLMDRELPDDERLVIKRIIEGHSKVHGMHDLRTNRCGMYINISFDIELDPDLSLLDAHQISRELENSILAHYPNADIIIHMDPKGDIYDARHKVQGIHH